MNTFTKTRKRAISTVLTTIIILVASVVLGSGVVLYGTSLFQGGTLTESIAVSGLKMWVHSTDTNGLAWGAFSVRNNGDKLVSVDKISIRGNDVPFSQWYVDTTVTTVILQQQMNFSGWDKTGATLRSGFMDDVNGDGCGAGGEKMQVGIVPGDTTTAGSLCANAASGPTSLEPGVGALIYFKLTNGSLKSIDAGASTTVNIFAGKTGAPLSISVSGKT